MIVECENCGAPLDIVGSPSHARCSYCGLSNRVKKMKTLAAVTPAAWRPPPIWQPPAHVRAAGQPALTYSPAPAPRSRGCMMGAVALGVVVFVGGIAAVLMVPPADRSRERAEPAVPAWDGRAPLVCVGNESLRVTGVRAILPGRTAITVDGSCEAQIVDSHIEAAVGVAVGGSAAVVLVNTTIVASDVGIDASGNSGVEIRGSRISGGRVGVDVSGNAGAQLSQGRIEGGERAIRTSANAGVEMLGGTEIVEGRAR